MHNHESSFHSPLSAEHVLEGFLKFADDRHWQVTSEDEHWVRVQSGPTLRAMGEDIEVSAEPDSNGSQVHVAVRSRMGYLQLVDWGEARTFHREIVAWLRSWDGRKERNGDW